ncbi:MAG TPA: Stp1/IreP family PP2C-type Ser/Thr phosphatase [Capillimicrobium sp.]|nr:Stp1/IreP family PP2C-type Ser/Thr phosphatase [Capillimicrobium sp.]
MLRVADKYAASDTGQQRRGNEDAFFVQSPLFVVADGMGGAQAGEVASGLAVDAFRGGLPDGGEPTEARLARLVQLANEEIHRRSRADAEQAGMGTTLTAAYVDVDGVAIAHVGDSRAYRWHDGRLERLTDDHSLVEELIRQGRLSEAEAEEHPQRSIITRALGPEPLVQVDTRTSPARDGDLFLLCSDGLTGMIGEQGVAEVLAQGGSLRDMVRRLIDAANRAGGRDNITVVLFRVEEVEPSSGGDPAQASTTASHPAVRAAVAEAPPAQAAGPAPPRRPHPRAAAPRKRRGRGARITVALVALVVVCAIGLGVYAGINSVYFVGTDDEGRVALFRGLPYELPLGIDLYSTQYRTGVPASSLPPARREALLDHKLRSHADAVDLVRQLELGQLQGS